MGMLRDAENIRVEEDADFAFAPAPAMPAPAGPAVTVPTHRYGEGKGFNWTGALLTLLIHVVLIAAFLTIKSHIVHKREMRLTVMNLTPAPPPPASTPETPKPQQAVVRAPRPLVQTLIRTPVAVQTTSDPVPQPTPPAPAAANPAPPVPPAPPAIVQASDLGNKMLSGKAPSYPTESRRKHEQGTVLLSLTLGYDGRVSDISVSHSSGSERLDQAALAAVRKWRWEPTMRGGQPVMVRGVVGIPFVLQG
jgi:protein TonB